MKRISAAFILWLGLASAALAQNFNMPPPAGVTVGGFAVVASCGNQTLTVGKTAFGTMDATGTLCTAGGGSGGTSYTVNYGAPIGTKGTPGGFKDGSGNFQSFTGSVTNGLSVDCGAAGNTLCGLISSPIPAGTNLIGKVGIDQTTPGTTNGVQVNAALPAGTNSIGKVGINPSLGGGTPTFGSLSMSTATTTQLIALSGSTVTYVTSLRLMAGGTANVTFKYGTGTNCGTGTTTLSGPWPLTAQAGFASGSGTGAIMIVPAGQALCVTSDAAVQVTSATTYQQF